MKTKITIYTQSWVLVLFLSLVGSTNVLGQELRRIQSSYYYAPTITGEVFTTFDPSLSGKVRLLLNLDFYSPEDWALLSQPSALLDYYSFFGPNGTGDVTMRVHFTSQVPCADYCSETETYCQCLYLGQNTANSMGDWSTIIPEGAQVLIYPTGQDSFDIWGEGIVVASGTSKFYAQLPDFRFYKMPYPPTLSSMQNLLALRDTLNGQNNASLLYAVVDTTDHCPVDDTRSGKFWLSNNGYDTITSAKIGFGWNGVLQDSVTWTGMIPPYEHRTIHDFGGKLIHLDSLGGDMDIVVLGVNGQPDEEPGNNAWHAPSAKPTSIDQTNLVFEWKTSNFTQYNYFEIEAEDGTKLLQVGDSSVVDQIEPGIGDPYANGETYQFPVDITGYDHQCLVFRAYHLGGSYFGEYISLKAGEQEIFYFTGQAGLDHVEERRFYNGMPEPAVPTDEVVQASLRIKPNPATGQVVLQAGQLQAGEVSWAVYNLMGQLVWSQETVEVSGSASITIDVANWADGLYLVTINNKTSGQVVVAERLVVRH
jgi:Secretion system C-terminal sorting domain